MLRLTAIGTSGAVPRDARAQSAYLIESQATQILLDCGSGTFARLRARIDPSTLDAIVISHMHPDHFVDLIPLRYALKLESQRAVPLPVYLHPGGEPVLRSFVAAFSTGDFFANAFDLRTYALESPLRIGDLAVRFAPALHYVPCASLRVEHRDRSITYSADTAPTPELRSLAMGTDLLLHEASLGADGNDRTPRGHSNAREAAAIARDARAARLVLTHYPQNASAEVLANAARAIFDGPVDVADDGAMYDATAP